MIFFEAVEAFLFWYFKIEEIPAIKAEIKKKKKKQKEVLYCSVYKLLENFLGKNEFHRERFFFFDRCKYFHKINYFSYIDLGDTDDRGIKKNARS